MEDHVSLTGRSRYTTKVIRTGGWFRKETSVIIVLQVEEFYSNYIRGEVDRNGHADADRIDQGYYWRDATLEDLAMMGARSNEPTVEAVRRHARPHGSHEHQRMGARPAVPPAQPADAWPSFVRGYPDVPPPGFVPTAHGSVGGVASSTGESPQPPSAARPPY